MAAGKMCPKLHPDLCKKFCNNGDSRQYMAAPREDHANCIIQFFTRVLKLGGTVLTNNAK